MGWKHPDRHRKRQSGPAARRRPRTRTALWRRHRQPSKSTLLTTATEWSRMALARARFRCAKGRDYKPEANPETHESKRRKTSTQFIGCKFQLAVRPLPNGRWAVEIPGGPAALYNHGWNDSTAFAGARADAACCGI
jgi:hypothetical protein